MNTADARRLVATQMTEAELQGWVATSARMLGWLVYHTYDSRRSEAGYPDTTLVRGSRLVYAELKSMRGKVTAAQQQWLDALRRVPGVEVYVWRPDELDTILDILRDEQPPVAPTTEGA